MSEMTEDAATRTTSTAPTVLSTNGPQDGDAENAGMENAGPNRRDG